MKKTLLGLLAGIAIVSVTASGAVAQPAPIPLHREPYVLDTGLHDGRDDALAPESPAFRGIVEVPDAPWLRLQVTASELGAGSWVTFTSRLDGGHQRLDATSLADAAGGSAFFNGDAVIVELWVGPGDRGVFLRIEEVTVGDWVGGVPLDRSLCNNDDRVSSTDPRAGRIVPIGCTGWIVSNGAHVTAGHCVSGGTTTLEFNIPPSLCDGTIVFADPDDQYPIDQSSFVGAASGIGDDFASYDCFPNSNTGLLPIHAQGFYRMSRDVSPPDVRITGCGTDNTPPGCTGNRNSDSQTLQTNFGTFLREVVQNASDVYLEYTVDTTGGNSGSPVIVQGSDVTMGVHTHAGCNPPNDGNHGTSFENDDFEAAVQNFLGPGAVHVDGGHPGTIETGEVLRPWDTVAEGVAAVPSGGLVAIVTGTYGEVLTISDPMTLVATGGTVVIGQ